MHIKFMSHGTGSAKGAATYLTQTHDHKGEVRPGIETLRGDVNNFAAIADGLAFKRKYTSSVIAWSAEDQPTDEQIDEALDLYEKVAFAGFESDRYCFAAVKHEETDGGVHVHIVNACVDLETGKSINICPPNHIKAFDNVRDHLNYKHDWTRPDDPERMRAQGFDRNSGEVKATKDSIHAYVEEGVLAGAVTDRESLKDWCGAADLQVNRESAKYISFKLGDSKPVRMKGALYEQDFKADETSVIKEERGKHGVTEQRAKDLAGASLERIQNTVERRAKYNRDRYQPRQKDSLKEHQKGNTAKDESLDDNLKMDNAKHLDSAHSNTMENDRSKGIYSAFNKRDTDNHKRQGRALSGKDSRLHLPTAGDGTSPAGMDGLQKRKVPKDNVSKKVNTNAHTNNEINRLREVITKLQKKNRTNGWSSDVIKKQMKIAYDKTKEMIARITSTHKLSKASLDKKYTYGEENIINPSKGALNETEQQKNKEVVEQEKKKDKNKDDGMSM